MVRSKNKMDEMNRKGNFLKSITEAFKSITKSDGRDDDKSVLTNHENPGDNSNHDSAKLANSKWQRTKMKTVITELPVENGKKEKQQGRKFDVEDDLKMRAPENDHFMSGITDPKPIENGLQASLYKKPSRLENKTSSSHIGQREEVKLKRPMSLSTITEKQETSDDEDECLLQNDETSDYETLPKSMYEYEDLNQGDGLPYISDNKCHGELLQHFSMSVPDLRSKARNEEDITDLRPLHYYKVTHAKTVQITGENGYATINKVTKIANNVALRHLNILNGVRGTKHRVETELFKGGQKMLNREDCHPLIIFKGTGYGCSFSAKMLFERVVSARENEAKPYYLKDPHEISQISHEENAIILATDINGPIGDDMGRLNAWYEWLKEYMPIGTSKLGKLTLIMNLQDFKSQENKIHPILEKYCEYIVDAAKKEFRPTGATKAQLLMAFMQQNNVGIRRIKGESVSLTHNCNEATLIDKEIVDGIIPLLGSVRCVWKLAELFRSDFAEGLNILTKPLPEIVRRIRESYKEGGTLFLTLIAVYAHGGQLGIGEVNQMRKLNEQCEKFWYSADNITKQPRSKSRNMERWFNSKCLHHLYKYAQENNHLLDLGNNLQRYARKLDGEFLSENNQVYRFCDGRVHYSFLLVYCEMFPDAIENCEDHFFYNFVHSTRNVQDFENDTVLKIDDRKLNSRTRYVMKRFENEIMMRHVSKCMKHPLMGTNFFQLFLKFLGETKHLPWKILTQQDSDPTEPYSCLYHGMEIEQDTFKGVPRNIAEVIILTDIWRKKRNKKKWKNWICTQETETLIHAAEMSNSKTFELMVEKGVQIQKPALLKAIDVGAEKIIEFICLKGCFSKKEKSEIAQYAATKISKEPDSYELAQALQRLILNVDINGSVGGDVPPLIHHAVQTNNTVLLNKLFDGSIGNSDVNINAKFKEEKPLAMATRLGFEQVTAILIKNGAKPIKHDAFMAVSDGQTEILKLFLKKSPQILHDTNGQKQTLLHIAAEKGHSELLRLLIDLNVPVDAKDINNETSLSLACNGKNMHVIRIILHAWNERKLRQDEMVVMRAVQNGDTELLEIFLEYNFSIDFVNREFGVPLHVAIQYGLHEMVQFLLSKGADPNIKQDGHSPVHVAAAKDDIESLLALKENGADLFVVTDTNDSIIHLAAEKSHVNFIEAVLGVMDCSLLIDLKNKHWETALHIACKHGCVALTKLLLEIGFNPKLPNKNGFIPESLAEQRFQKLSQSTAVKTWAPYADCVKALQTSCKSNI